MPCGLCIVFGEQLVNAPHAETLSNMQQETRQGPARSGRDDKSNLNSNLEGNSIWLELLSTR